jgi:hypothetical protein
MRQRALFPLGSARAIAGVNRRQRGGKAQNAPPPPPPPPGFNAAWNNRHRFGPFGTTSSSLLPHLPPPRLDARFYLRLSICASAAGRRFRYVASGAPSAVWYARVKEERGVPLRASAPSPFESATCVFCAQVIFGLAGRGPCWERARSEHGRPFPESASIFRCSQAPLAGCCRILMLAMWQLCYRPATRWPADVCPSKCVCPLPNVCRRRTRENSVSFMGATGRGAGSRPKRQKGGTGGVGGGLRLKNKM